jgi:hypothetical protein
VAQKKAGILLKVEVEVVKVVIVLVISLMKENEGAKEQENTCKKRARGGRFRKMNDPEEKKVHEGCKLTGLEADQGRGLRSHCRSRLSARPGRPAQTPT